MKKEHPETPPRIRVDGSGAAAAAGGVAAGAGGYAAGRDINVNITEGYLIMKGPIPHQLFRGDPSQPWNPTSEGTIEVSDLKKRLLAIDPSKELKNPKTVTVEGTLYPCALLLSGWWERRKKATLSEPDWKGNTMQAWLFHGFHEWGPSWDFTWDFEGSEKGKAKPYFIAQLGDGDEANSIPVIIPYEKPMKLREIFLERGRGLGIPVSGFDVTLTGLLSHRLHFRRRYPREWASLGLLDDILDYCIWLKEGEKDHKIKVSQKKTEVYSGYLWKCVAPREWVEKSECLDLNQVYFVWEHTNFAAKDAINYNLDSLAHKEAYIREKHGDLVLLQKSSLLVPGEPRWPIQKFYDCFGGTTGEEI